MNKEDGSLNNLTFRADFYRALFSICKDNDNGLGLTEEYKNPLDADGLKQVIKLRDYNKNHTDSKVILVGFEGYTDSNGDVSTIRPLILEKRWERVL